ncbi:MAG: dihydrofolate reductase [Eubacteriales bacterium]
MNVIAAVDSNWAIGYQNKLLVSIPNDMKFFRSETKGKVVVLGRKTLETFPGKRPLEQRTNIILSTDKTYEVKGATVVHSVEELLEQLNQYPTEDIYIIGGTSVYELMLPYCNTAHITKIHHAYAADSYFPNLDHMEEWVVTRDSEEQTYFDLEYQFLQYEKRGNE